MAWTIATGPTAYTETNPDGTIARAGWSYTVTNGVTTKTMVTRFEHPALVALATQGKSLVLPYLNWLIPPDVVGAGFPSQAIGPLPAFLMASTSSAVGSQGGQQT